MNVENIGKIGYDAYREHSGGVSLVSGEPLPFWEDQTPEIRAAWDAAALAVSAFVGGPSTWQRDELALAEGDSTVLMDGHGQPVRTFTVGESKLGEGDRLL